MLCRPYRVFLLALPPAQFWRHFLTTLQTMNHELRCYLRLRVNIPNEILLLIEKYLWQLNFAFTNLIIKISFSQHGLLYLHLNQYKQFHRKSGNSTDSKLHYYGQECTYNRTLAISKRLYWPERTKITCIHNGSLTHSIFFK